MRKFNLIIILFYIFLSNVFYLNLNAGIKNSIVVKVGETLITAVDIQNEVLTGLVIEKKEISQENINNYKNFAVKNLIKKTIKRNEIKKYEVTNYNKKDLSAYIQNIAKIFETNQAGLKEMFNQFNIDYSAFVENHETELLWNTLIYEYYRNQLNINMVEINNNVETLRGSKNEEELKEFKKILIDQKKNEKLNLFSRSHFSNLENSVVVEFQ